MVQPLFFGKQREKRVFIIAEIGKNFIQTEEDRPVSEYLENAKKLVKAVQETGADAVKFQTHWVEDEQLPIAVVSPHFRGADRYSWVKRNTEATPLDAFWRPLKSYCDELGVLFFSTPMSRGAAEILEKVGVSFWKVGSGDILDFVLLDYLAETKKPIILSSGMSTREELDKAVDFLKRRSADITILHCVSKYPCPPEDLRLGTIKFLRDRYAVSIGFSDHSLGIDSALSAAALGAQIIEKHFSFSRDLWGADHKVSMTPDELNTLVRGVRALESDSTSKQKLVEKLKTEEGFDKQEKILQEDEVAFRPYFRKSLMAGCDIAKGTMIIKNMLYAMRPQAYAGGLPSEEYENVIGMTARRSLRTFDPITRGALDKKWGVRV